MPDAKRSTLTVTFTEQQVQVLDQLRQEGAYGDDRETVIKRLLALYANERLTNGGGAEG